MNSKQDSLVSLHHDDERRVWVAAYERACRLYPRNRDPKDHADDEIRSYKERQG